MLPTTLQEIHAAIQSIPQGNRFESLDGAFAGRTEIDIKSLKPGHKQTYEAYLPFIDKIDFSKMKGGKAYQSRYEGTYRLIAAHMLRSMFESGAGMLHGMQKEAIANKYVNEATLSGSNVIAFGRQILDIIYRAMPMLISPQLFPTRPMSSAEARIYWRNLIYDTTYASQSPNISAGDRIDDLSKFNTGYPNANQLASANGFDVDFSHYIRISALTKRLGGTVSVEGAQDLEDNMGASFADIWQTEAAFLLQATIDWLMINSAYTNVPGANQKTWDAKPTINSVAWANLQPSEKEAYNQTLYSDGINGVISAMAALRYLTPNWILAGPKFCEALERCKHFVALREGLDKTIQTGAIRDMGQLDAGGIRVLRCDWPVIPTNVALFGRMPDNAFDPGIRFCPYKPIQFLPPLTGPRTAKTDYGAITRFGIGGPDLTQDGTSSILAEVYGTLAINNYY